MADTVKVEYDKQDLRIILKSFKAMSDRAVAESKKVSHRLADKAADKIRNYSLGSRFIASYRLADSVHVSKSSKIGEFSYGYKSERFFSGGATTLDMIYGLEFGSNRLPQFPPRSARGRTGYFIYPTLRKLQPELIRDWESAFTEILEEFN